MPRIAQELGALAVKKLTTTPGNHFVGGAPGLMLQVTGKADGETSASWILRVMVNARRKEIGLGGYPAVGLADAREAAQQARAMVQAGTDPVQLKQEQAKAKQAEQNREVWTFRRCAEAYHKAHAQGWVNVKHRAQWINTLATYAFPLIGDMHIADIGIELVRQVLAPDWHTKTETMQRVRGRMECVFGWATVQKLRTGQNPATWKNNLDMLLPAPGKIKVVKHRPALPVGRLYAFMQALQSVQAVSAKCLAFGILTAVRSRELREALWTEIDFTGKIWTLNGGRMKVKGKGDHRVPLSDQAIELLQSMPRMAGTDLIFPSPALEGKPMCSDALMRIVRKLEGKDVATMHGFRTTFRTWGASLGFNREVMEHCLAHAVGSKVERAYQRGDLLELRKPIMEAWGRFAFTPTEQDTGNVVEFRPTIRAA